MLKIDLSHNFTLKLYVYMLFNIIGRSLKKLRNKS